MPNAQLRTWAHPIMYAVPMYICSLVGIDSQVVVAALPRLIQACLAAVGDIAAAYIYVRVLGKSQGRWAYAMHLLNFFMLYTFVRPFSNCVESSMFWVALAMWPTSQIGGQLSSTDKGSSTAHAFDWFSSPGTQRWQVAAAIALGGLSIALRPTAAVPWAFLGAVLLLQQRSVGSFLLTAGTAGSVLMLVLALSVGLDTLVYGGSGYTFVLWNFFDFNFNAGLSALYGTHPVHWYFTAAVPVMLGFMLPLFLWGVLIALRSPSMRGGALFWLALFVFCVGLYSVNGHKEFRFILPLYPVLFIFCGIAMHALADRHFAGPAEMSSKAKQEAKSDDTQDRMVEEKIPENLSADGQGPRARRTLAEAGGDSSADEDHANTRERGTEKSEQPQAAGLEDGAQAQRSPSGPHKGMRCLYPAVLSLLVVGNAVAAVYLSIIHQGGVVSAVDFIAAEAAAFRATPGMIYAPELHGATGATAQAYEWNYIREKATLGALNKPLIPGFPPPTGDKSVLRKQALQGPRALLWQAPASGASGTNGWLDTAPAQASGVADRFKHGFTAAPHMASVLTVVQQTDEAIWTWLQWPVQQERLAAWAVSNLGGTAAAMLGLVSLDPWGNPAVKPNVRRAKLRWAMKQRDLQRQAQRQAGDAPQAEYVPMIVHFWMGCHSTPFYSVVHEPIEMTQLECPPLARQAGTTDAEAFLKDPVDFLEHKWYGAKPSPPPPPLPVKKPTLVLHDIRYAGPVHGMHLPALKNETGWLDRHHTARRLASFNSMQRYNASRDSHDLPKTQQLPTHIVTTAGIAKKMRGWLLGHDYFEAARFFHAHVQGDADATGEDFGEVVVFRHGSWTPWALMAGRASIRER